MGRGKEVGHGWNIWQTDTEKRNKRGGIHQERDGDNGHNQTTVAFLGWWAMLPASEQTGIRTSVHACRVCLLKCLTLLWCAT